MFITEFIHLHLLTNLSLLKVIWWNEFIEKATLVPGEIWEKYHFTVTEGLFYGQDAAENTKVRFLVYHTPKNIFQHRFLDTFTASAAAKKLQGMSTATATSGVGTLPAVAAAAAVLTSVARATFGQYLRQF